MGILAPPVENSDSALLPIQASLLHYSPYKHPSAAVALINSRLHGRRVIRGGQ